VAVNSVNLSVNGFEFAGAKLIGVFAGKEVAIFWSGEVISVFLPLLSG
jgi:hypothetical protein